MASVMAWASGASKSTFIMAVMPWGTVLVGITTTCFSVRRGALLGGHDDVAVVGQDEHRLRRDLIDALQNALGGGVHGLPAGHHAVGAQIPEHGGKAVAGADRQEAVRSSPAPPRWALPRGGSSSSSMASRSSVLWTCWPAARSSA